MTTPEEQTVLHLHRRENDTAPGVETKELVAAFEIKDETKGIVEAIVAMIGEMDRDGDVILPGAIPQGSTVLLSDYGHDVVKQGKAPVGLGTMSEENGRGIVRAAFFMDVPRARDSFHTVKAMGPHARWSYGFPNENITLAPMTKEWAMKGARRLIASMTPVEASPVFRPAGYGTRTLAVKETDEAEAARKAEEEAKAAQEAAEIEVKRLAEEIEQKARVEAAVAEYQRVQRSLKRMGVA